MILFACMIAKFTQICSQDDPKSRDTFGKKTFILISGLMSTGNGSSDIRWFPWGA